MIHPFFSFFPHAGIKINTSPDPNPVPGLQQVQTQSQELIGQKPGILNYVVESNDTFENLELPDLKVEDIEAVISEHSDWSQEQIENFFRSLDLSEVECAQSFSGSGYDSDSGYSTYDVSPVGSSISSIGHYNSSLSPAITPVTPTPILSSSSSSPLPIGPFQEEFMPGAGILSTLLTITPQSASEGYFSGFDLPTLPPHSVADSFQDQPFSPHYPCSVYQFGDCITQCPVPPSSITNLQFAPPMHYQTSYPTASDIQSTPPATSNLASIEEDKHTVILVPNAYNGHMTQSIGLSPTTPQLVLEPVQCTSPPAHSSSVTQMEQEMSAGAGSKPLHHPPSPPTSCPLPSTSAFSEREMKRQLSLPELERGDAMLLRSPTQQVVDGFGNQVTPLTSPSQTFPPLPKPHSQLPKQQRCPSDRTVYAQVLPPTSTFPPHTLTPSPEQASSPHCLVKESTRGLRTKSRQLRSGSVPMKRQKRNKSQWPKSMNPGNLMAFRNFILNKLKKGQEKPMTVTGVPQPLSHSLHRSVSETSSTSDRTEMGSPTITHGLTSPRDCSDLLSDASFNPDTLLSADLALDSSPFDLLSPSATPDDAFSVTSPESQFLNSEIDMDFDGYAQLLSTDDLPLSEGLTDSALSCLNSDLENIFKTDQDPLLGGLS